MHPSVFIDDRGHWHEDYWFLIFPTQFDCWDREESDYEEEPLELGGYLLHSVYTYRLNSDLLDKTRSISVFYSRWAEPRTGSSFAINS